MNMLVGLIADVHADIQALQRAYTIFEAYGVEVIYCAGDLVGKGPSGDKVVQFVKEHGITTVCGNHDVMARAEKRWLIAGTSSNQTAYGTKQLTTSSIDFLDTLPSYLQLSFSEKSIYLAHGSPRSIDEYVFPYSHPDLFREVIDLVTSNIVVLGHTHEPMLVNIQDRWIVNPGSVCSTYAEGSGTCAILSLPSYNLKVFDIRTRKRVRIPFIEL